MPPGATYVVHIHAHRPFADPGNQTFSPGDENTHQNAGTYDLHFYLLNMDGQLRVRRGTKNRDGEETLTDGKAAGFYDSKMAPSTWRSFIGDRSIFLRKDNTFTPIPNLGALISFIHHTKFLDWIDQQKKPLTKKEQPKKRSEKKEDPPPPPDPEKKGF